MGQPTSREIAEQLIAALDRESLGVDHDARIALASALPVLRRAMAALALPSERQQARSAYRLAAAALGVEHD